ncbi:hypothetical protein [Corynebacterium lactis]|uniref:SWIM zinc finger family protein n=1 Tax=Corynebacterium lactis TaxID=1231000 RepID=UPI0009E73A0C|nr:hypothetical protein [Corynebacterium lactis]
MSIDNNDPAKDVTWGDNVIFAEFGKNRAGNKSGKRCRTRRTTGEATPSASSAIEKLLATQDWAGAFQDGARRRKTRDAVEPRTTFARWTWEFILRGCDEGRIRRGEKYYREGQVLSTRIADGYVLGEVQGSQLDPFSVFIRFPRRDRTDVDRVLQWLVDNPAAIGDFERGELPFDQMEALLCDTEEHVYCECTCPDPAPVCKHVVAVASQLVSQIDDEPLSLLELRGYPTRELQRRLAELTAEKPRRAPKRLGLGGQVRPETKPELKVVDETSSHAEPVARPRPVDTDFWGRDLPRVEVPELEEIDPLVLTDRSLLHEALQPTCVISRETIRAVSDLEDCWYHLKQALSLSQREK